MRVGLQSGNSGAERRDLNLVVSVSGGYDHRRAEQQYGGAE
jgi:hypothetical protein